VSLGERIRAARRRQESHSGSLVGVSGFIRKRYVAWDAETVKKPFRRLVRMFEKYVKSVGEKEDLLEVLALEFSPRPLPATPTREFLSRSNCTPLG
jgi:hypothetical protein